MRNYKVLSTSVYECESLKLVPVRHEDRFEIMNWRNRQIEYLRQSRPLTEDEQNNYFSNVVASQFEKDNPEQLLFSYLKNNELIGYGGLVHIDWRNKHAEISFLLNPDNNNEISYLTLFSSYLALIEKVAVEINLNKIFTVGYDLISYRFEPLVGRKYDLDARLKDHKVIDEKPCDVLIYSKLL